MSDSYDAATRSRVMARVKGRDTGPEMTLRRALHRRGLRYRLHGASRGASLPGKPDLVFARRKAAVFVHGCFWHRHPGCKSASTPATRLDYWGPKFARTVARDAEAARRLLQAGWRVAVIWECALKKGGAVDTAKAVAAWLDGREDWLEIPGPAGAVRTRPAPDSAP